MSFNVWQPQGVLVAHTATFYPANPNVLWEGNSQLGLPGTVFKMWYCDIKNTGLYYAESTDGSIWTQDLGNPILAGVYYPKIFKNGSTYYLYANTSTTNINAYTSLDGVTWVLAKSAMLTPTQPWENAGIFQLAVAGQDASGTWWGYYSGNTNSSGAGYLTGQAFSTDLVNWSKHANSNVASMSSGTMVTGGAWLGAGNFCFLKSGGFYYGWSQTSLINNPGAPTPGTTWSGNVPSDIMRWRASNPAGPWIPLGSITYYRTLANEGISIGGTAATALGQVADPTLVEANGAMHLFYTVSPDGEGFATYFEINHATSSVSLAQLVSGYEGIVNIPIPFPGTNKRSFNFTSPVASDNFVRASLGSNWTQAIAPGTTFSALTIDSNFGASSIVGKPSYAFYNQVGSETDQWAQISVKALGGGVGSDGCQVASVLRADPGVSGTFYNAILYGFTSGPIGTPGQQLYLQKYVNGAVTNLAFASGITAAVGDVITGCVVGSTLSLYYNGYLILVVTDNSVASGKPGAAATFISAQGNALFNGWNTGSFQLAPAVFSGSGKNVFAVEETNISATTHIAAPRIFGPMVE